MLDMSRVSGRIICTEDFFSGSTDAPAERLELDFSHKIAVAIGSITKHSKFAIEFVEYVAALILGLANELIPKTCRGNTRKLQQVPHDQMV